MELVTNDTKKERKSGLPRLAKHACDVLRFMMPPSTRAKDKSTTTIPLTLFVEQIKLSRYLAVDSTLLTPEMLLTLCAHSRIPTSLLPSGEWAATLPISILEDFSAPRDPDIQTVFTNQGICSASPFMGEWHTT